jgi:hypothetical protein
MLRRHCDAGVFRMALNGAYEHPKTRRLARTLGLDPWAALGLMEAVWAWVRKAARDGRIDLDQWEDLADYLRWRQPAAELTKLLVDAKFVDAQDGWWWVHDWDQHADDTTRKALDRSGKGFANGAMSRQWRKGESPKQEESSPEVHRNEEKVRVTASARPEPEPEPVPVPEPAAAANISDGSTALNAATPPAAAIAEVLRTAMPMGTPPPDGDIVRRVQAAMQGASLAELAAAVIRYRKRGKTPDSYGFWPMYVQDTLAPGRRAELGAISVPEEAAPRPSVPACQLCRGGGVMGRVAPDATPEGIRSAIRAGGRLCECEIGAGWADYFAMDDDGDDVPVIRRGAGAGYAAVAR